MLDYWNLSYKFKTLLSSKEARQLPLEYFYGLKITFVKGNEESLRSHIHSGYSAICLCTASKLDFFPRTYLGMEASGFQHSILLYGWDEQQEHYLVTDPVVNTVVTMSPEEVACAGAIRQGCNEVYYFILEEPVIPFSEPDLKSCLTYCTERNMSFYRNQQANKSGTVVPENSAEELKVRAWLRWFNERHSGIRALEHFEEDLTRSSEWTERRRNEWIVINTKTISSIRSIRSLVWNAYRDMAELDEALQEEGQRQVDTILAEWNAVIFLLLKYKIVHDDSVAIPSILKHVKELKCLELQFLEWLHQIIRKGERHELMPG